MTTAPAPSRRGSYSSPRQQQRQRRILEVVREQIAAVGYEALTMREMAAASGVALKTLYNLYGSKDELLLAAVADLLSGMQQGEVVTGAGPGIPHYLAHVEAMSRQMVATPEYADAMARSLVQAGQDHQLVDVLLGGSIRAGKESLQHAQNQGELIDNLDVEEAARMLAGHQWSVVLMWNKGLVPLDSVPDTALRSTLVSLIPMCVGALRRQLQEQFEGL